MQAPAASQELFLDTFALPEKHRETLAQEPDTIKDLRLTFVPTTGTERVRQGLNVARPIDRPDVTIRQIRLLLVN
jgi:hypothetical protein